MVAATEAPPAVLRRPRLVRAAPRGAWSVTGFTVLWTVAILVPFLCIVLLSFLQMRGFAVVFAPTLRAYQKLFFEGGGPVIWRTIRISLTITAVELLAAFPFALWLAKGARNPTLKLVTFTLLTVPFFLSPAARTIVWRSVLGREGLVNSVLMGAGLVDQPVEWLLFSDFATQFGLIGPYFPTMVWPIFLSISLIDDEYLEASKDLGASGFRTLVHVILPLSLPGIVAGIVFTFIPMLGDNVVPQLLGGNNALMLSVTVQSLIGAINYTAAAALSAVVLAIMLVLQTVLWLVLRPAGGLNQVFAGLKR